MSGKFGQNGMSGQKGKVHLGTVGAWSMAVVLWQKRFSKISRSLIFEV